MNHTQQQRRLQRITSHLTSSSSSSSSSSSLTPLPSLVGLRVVVHNNGALVHLYLDRTKSLNAVNGDVRESLHSFLDWVHTNSRVVRVVVIKGSGRAFCAGLDLRDGDPTAHTWQHFQQQQRLANVIVRIHRSPQVYIAAIHGAASGFGLALTLACDFRVGTSTCKLNVAMRRIGMTGCDLGISYLLPRVVKNNSTAKWLMYTGAFVEGEDALRIGLLDRMVPADALDNEVNTMATQLLAGSPWGLRMTKECANHSIDASSLEQAVAMEDRQQILTVAAGDFMEGVSAFLQKREPEYYSH